MPSPALAADIRRATATLARLIARLERSRISGSAALSATAARDLMLACKRGLRASRHQLSLAAQRGRPVPPPAEWREAAAALDTGGRRLLRRPGVLGVGLGFKHVNGVQTHERCIAVFVARKSPKDVVRRRGRQLLPTYLTSPGGVKVPVDVVEFRPPRRQASAPERSLGPVGTRRFATLGTFAVDDRDRLVALTAMHLFEKIADREVDVTLPAEYFDSGAEVFGRLAGGTTRGIDAAKIVVEGTLPRSPWTLAGRRIHGWRDVLVEGDDHSVVWMFGATSGMQEGIIKYHHVVGSEASALGLDAAILVSIYSQPGDSGSALVDREGMVLGLLWGQENYDSDRALRVFSPISLVLDRLNCDIPHQP